MVRQNPPTETTECASMWKDISLYELLNVELCSSSASQRSEDDRHLLVDEVTDEIQMQRQLSVEVCKTMYRFMNF